MDHTCVSRRVQCLKYLVLASVLMESKVWGVKGTEMYTRAQVGIFGGQAIQARQDLVDEI